MQRWITSGRRLTYARGSKHPDLQTSWRLQLQDRSIHLFFFCYFPQICPPRLSSSSIHLFILSDLQFGLLLDIFPSSVVSSSDIIPAVMDFQASFSLLVITLLRRSQSLVNETQFITLRIIITNVLFAV